MKPSLVADASLRSRVSPAEWETRVNLAACYRLVAHYRMTDMIYTHISARLPEEPSHFLINPYGLMFEEITATSLVKIDEEAKVLEDPLGLGVNPAGFTIHSAIHAARPEINCVLHTHTMAGIAVSAQEHGLLPLSQHAMRFWNRVAYHDYEGVALDLDERTRLQRDLGPHSVMILRNHGLLACGDTVREAFELIYYLERACQAQIGAMAGGATLHFPPPEVAEKVAQQFARPVRRSREKDWPALIRLLDRTDPSYRE